jgi:hypothetical protein
MYSTVFFPKSQIQVIIDSAVIDVWMSQKANIWI